MVSASGGFAVMVWVGTSGYNYPEWKGSFYPADLPAAKMLPYYAARFATVEINYTFYRMPNEKLVGGWASQTPSPFKLTLKAPRRITHDNRLKNCADLVRAFCGVAGTLGDKLGALLFQLPPNLKKDLGVFDAFVDDAGVRLVGGHEHVRAVVPSVAQQRLLGLPRSVGALAIDRLGYAGDRPIEWRHTLIRGDRFSLTADFSHRTGYQLHLDSRCTILRPAS